MRPLDFLRSIKVKFGVVIVVAVLTAHGINEIGLALNYLPRVRILVAIVLTLIMVQIVAHGMTRPLREMSAAARAMARGRYGLRVRATSRDEVGELARAFNTMASDLAEVERHRREFIADVSHELRTPITALHAVLENLVDGVEDPDPQTLRTALAQTGRLSRLVRQLLDLSRLESGNVPLAREVVEVGPLCAQAVREAEMVARDRSVRLEYSVHPAGLEVSADPDLLPQVLANLFGNAIRHSPPGGTVLLSARGSDGRVLFSVADEGPGIPAADRERALQRFSRLDAGRSAQGGGAGLGLAIVREIVELHDGTLGIEDNTPTGCRMVVGLPWRNS